MGGPGRPVRNATARKDVTEITTVVTVGAQPKASNVAGNTSAQFAAGTECAGPVRALSSASGTRAATG